MLADLINNYWLTWGPGALLATLGVLAIIWKVLVWLINGAATLKELRTSLPLIQAEFSPNHGSSMKDRVEALHDNQTELASRFRKHVADDERNFNKLEAVLDRIEDKL